MKFTLSWLKEYLDTDASLEEISEKLTALGLEVDGIEDKAAEFAPFKVAYVKSAEKHPDADKLQVCMVETADHGTVQVVCGAPNARAGMKAIFAPSGAYIPGLDVTLKKSEIRGVESNGMLVSEKEMCLSDEHKGIIDLPEDTEIGKPMAQIFGLDDPVIEISLTPDRADCAGIYGIARDLASAGLGKLKLLDVSEVDGTFEPKITTSLDFEGKDNTPCPLFLSRTVRGVKNDPSPEWLQQKLRAIGLRPISALVDITNYMSIALCRPLHVFDAAKLKGNLAVRLSKGGEELNGLNDKSYTLEPDMTVVCDDSGVIGLGGVVGGVETGCTEETTEVVIECAYFDPVRTALTGRKLQVNSDARYRFERGIDPAFTVPAMEIATRMVMDLCGGEPSTVHVAGSVPNITREIEYNPALCKKLLGIEIAEDTQIEILNKLGFTGTKKGETYLIKTPSWRGDVEGAADLVEEVIRVYGYDRLETVTLDKIGAVTKPAETYKTWMMRKARAALAGHGLSESVTWSFMSKEQAEIFGSNDNQEDGMTLLNPISEDLSHMRPSILPNLIIAAGQNADRGYANAALFEVGPVFFGKGEKEQPICAAGIRAHSAEEKSVHGAGRNVDLFDAKADIFAALDALGFDGSNAQISRETPDWYHPGRSGCLRLGKNVLGYFGEIHPMTLEQLDVEGPVVGFELFLENVPERKYKGANKQLLTLNPLMPLHRDFAFVVDQDVEAHAILQSAKSADKKLITDATVFDVYQGKGVEEGKKSVAVSVTLQPKDQSLTDKEIDAISQSIIEAVQKRTGGALR